jgi:hypothetical protein
MVDAVSALRSVAFGFSVLLTTVLLLVCNLGVWLFAGVLDQAALTRAIAAAIAEPDVRSYVSRQVGVATAGVVLDQGNLRRPLEDALSLPARYTATDVAKELTRRIDALLADGADSPAVVLASSAFAQLVRDVLEDEEGDLTRDGLVVDLSPLGRFVLDEVDGSGTLAGAVGPRTATIRLIDGPVVSVLQDLVRSLDMLRVLLPAGCAVAIALTLALARYRVHALAWVGLGGVVAGTVSLLIASGGPVFASTAAEMPADRARAVVTALDTVTSSLVIQSAALAGLGLALVVAGIAGGVVVARDDSGRRDLRHGWDPGGLS